MLSLLKHVASSLVGVNPSSGTLHEKGFVFEKDHVLWELALVGTLPLTIHFQGGLVLSIEEEEVWERVLLGKGEEKCLLSSSLFFKIIVLLIGQFKAMCLYPKHSKHLMELDPEKWNGECDHLVTYI